MRWGESDQETLKKKNLRGHGTLKMRHSSGKGSNFINQWFFAWVAH